MATTLVWFAEFNDLAMDVVSAIANKMADGGDEFKAKCEAAFEANEYAELLHTVFGSSNALFLGTKNEKDIEGCFNVLCTLLVEKAHADKMADLVQELCKVVTSEESADSALRLKILANLYNQLDVENKSALRYIVFKRIVEYAAKTEHLNLLDSYLQNVDALLNSWGTSQDDTRALYLLLSKILEQPRPQQSHAFLLKFLRTFESDSENVANVKEQAAKALVATVKTPANMMSADNGRIMELLAVAQLESDPKYKQLFELMRIFVADKLPAYMDFYSANKAFVDSLGVDHAAAVENMRLLSLCSLALEHKEIPYTVVAETLQINADKVEFYVVEAIRQNMIDAKIDQLRQVIVMHSVMQRVFGDQQWVLLQTRLHAWKDHAQALLDVVKRQKDAMAM